VSFLIDMHTHTSDSSSCSSLGVEDLLLQAEQVGLGGVTITDHNYIEGGLKAERLSRRRNVKVFVGVEVSTEEIGDVLVYGLRQNFPDAPVPFRKLAKAVEKAGAVMFAAHPFRRHARNALWVYFEDIGFRWRHSLTLPELLAPLAGIEVYNGGSTPRENEEAALFAARFRLRGIAGSDAHNHWRVGWCATEFDYEIRNEEELVQALRLGRYRISRNQTEFDTEAERRTHMHNMANLRGQDLADYVADWRRRKQRNMP
jgi:predicted metal-dependent phosphoesterase TrpH